MSVLLVLDEYMGEAQVQKEPTRRASKMTHVAIPENQMLNI